MKNIKAANIGYWCCIGLVIVSIGITVIQQIHTIVNHADLQFVLDTVFTIFTIVYSLMLSATFLRSFNNVKNDEERKLCIRNLQVEQILMFLGLMLATTSYLSIRTEELNKLSYVLAICVMLACVIYAFVALQRNMVRFHNDRD